MAIELTGDSGFRRAYEAPNGEESSFDVLYRRYYPRLVHLCVGRLGDRAAAEDLAQETLLRLLNAGAGFDTSLPPWPWLKVVATRLCLDHLEAGQRRDRLERVGPRSEDSETPWRMVEERPLLALALKSLPRRQQIALALRYLDGWDSDDVANRLGLTRGGLEQLLFRARKKLLAQYRRISGEIRILMPTTFLSRTRNRFAKFRANSPVLRAGAISVNLVEAGARLLVGVVLTVAVVGLLQAGTGVDADTRKSPEDTSRIENAKQESSRSPAPTHDEKATRSFTAKVSSDGLAKGPETSISASVQTNKGTVRGKLEAKLPGNHRVDVPAGVDTDRECDYSVVQQQLCDAIDRMP